MSDFDQIVDDFFKNYHDRGMKKWAGYYLSDHTQNIEKDELKRNYEVKRRAKQTEEEISIILLDAFSNHKKVNIQLEEVDQEGKLVGEIEGFISGYFEEKIIIDDQQIPFFEIRNIVRLE